jgi:hypothetical protein
MSLICKNAIEIFTAITSYGQRRPTDISKFKYRSEGMRKIVLFETITKK